MIALIIILGLCALTLHRPAWGALGLLVGFSVGGRNFALLNLGPTLGLPIFVTEPVLACLFLKLFIKNKFNYRQIKWDSLKKNPWFWFFMIGLFNVLRGLWNASPIYVVRDAILVFYGLAAFTIPLLIKKEKHVYVMFFAVTVALLVRVVLKTFTTEFFEYETTSSMYIAIVILTSFTAYSLWKDQRRKLYPALILLAAVITSTGVRTAWVAFVFSIPFMVYLLFKFKMDKKAPLKMVGVVLAGIFCMSVYYSNTNPVLFKRLKIEFQTLFWGADSPHLMTRLGLWEDAIIEILPSAKPLFKKFDQKVLNPYLFNQEEDPLDGFNRAEYVERHRSKFKADNENKNHQSATSILKDSKVFMDGGVEKIIRKTFSKPKPKSEPISVKIEEPTKEPSFDAYAFVQSLVFNPVIKTLLGVPFGARFLPQKMKYVIGANRYDPHNSFIAVFFRTGVIGLLVFFWMVGSELKKSFVFALKTTNKRHKELMVACLVAFIYHCGHSMSDITLENPFKGLIFWLLLGLMMSIRSFSRKRA